jgi:phthalate 4,5-dioxygenase oxygenase subunit
MLMEAVTAYRDEGTLPPGVDNPALYRQRSGGVMLPKDVDVWEATEEMRAVYLG